MRRILAMLFLIACAVNFGKATEFYNVLGDRYLVYIVNKGGLANRLRAMADWYHLARRSKRLLLVSWEASLECNASFESLFDVEGMDLEEFLILPELIRPSPEQVINTAREKGMTAARVLHDEEASGFVLGEQVQRELESDVTQVVVTSYQGIFTLRHVSCIQYMKMRGKFLASLEPSARSRGVLESLQRQYFQERLVVGVHIRWHDHRYDWEVVPPMMEGERAAATALAFGDGAGLSDFESAMSEILAKHPNGTVRFLVMSNSAIIKQEVLSRFDDSVVTITGELERGSQEGMEFAALEFFALARTDLILHTYGSTFAEEAAQIRNVPLVGIWNKARIYSQDPRLAGCGLMQYVNAVGEMSPIPYTYTEGTRDQRGVDDPYYEISPCPFLPEWGLRDLHCSLNTSPKPQLDTRA